MEFDNPDLSLSWFSFDSLSQGVWMAAAIPISIAVRASLQNGKVAHLEFAVKTER